MRSRALLLPSVVFLAIFAGCSTSTTSQSPVDTAVFMQVETDHAWDYGTNIDQDWPQADSQYTYLRTAEEADEDGAIAFSFSRGLQDAQADPLLTVMVAVDGDGAVVINSYEDGEGTITTLEPPAVLGPSSWDVGDSVTTETSVSWTATLNAREQHEVHYGTFPDVAVVVVDDGGATPIGGTWYLAAEVGPVRVETDGDLIGSIDLLTYR